METSTPREAFEGEHAVAVKSSLLDRFEELPTSDDGVDGNVASKLVKAIGLVQLGLARASSQACVRPFNAPSNPGAARAANPRPTTNASEDEDKFVHSISQDADTTMTLPTSSDYLKPDEYAALIELLASALRLEMSKHVMVDRAPHVDETLVQQSTSDHEADKTVRGWKGKASALGRKVARSLPPPGPTAIAATSNAIDDVPNMLDLLDENLRLILRLLRDSTPTSSFQEASLDEPHKKSDHEDENDTAKTQDVAQSSSLPTNNDSAEAETQAGLLLLPPELQRRIFQLARTFSEDPSAWSTPASNTITKEERIRKSSKTSRPAANIYSFTPTPPFSVFDAEPSTPLGAIRPYRPDSKGGRRKAQEYAHALASVCRSLQSVSRRAAFDSVHIRTRRQVVKLVKMWKGDFDDFDKQENLCNDDPKDSRGFGGDTSFERRRRRAPFSFLSGWDDSSISSTESFETIISDPVPKNKDAPGKGEAQKVEACGKDDDVIFNDEQLSKHNFVEEAKLVRREELKCSGQCVRYLNIEVPAVADDNDRENDIISPIRRRHRRRRAFGFAGLRAIPDLDTCLADLQATRKSVNETKRSHLPELFALVPNLRELSLFIHPHRSNNSIASGLVPQGFGSEVLEMEVLGALCGLKNLRILTIKQFIDFCELDVLMPSLPELKELRLEGGLVNGDGRGDVDPDAEHFCQLQVFTLHHLDFENNDVSAAQLMWILGRSIGTLEHLDLILHVGGPSNPHWVNVDAAMTAPFACRPFADLLVKLAPTLKHLGLRDISSYGQAHTDMGGAPYNGYLDYALLHCTKLESLALEWFATGNTFLDCLSYTPDYIMEGTPNELETSSQWLPQLDAVQSDATTTSTTIATSHKSEGWPSRPLKTLTMFGAPERTSAQNMIDMLTRHHVDPLDDDIQQRQEKTDNADTGDHDNKVIGFAQEADADGDETSNQTTNITATTSTSTTTRPAPPASASATTTASALPAMVGNHQVTLRQGRSTIALPHLQSITLSAFPTQRAGQLLPWSSRDLRRLKQVCELRDIWFGFAS